MCSVGSFAVSLGRSMPDRPVLIVDLDGTILSINSFRPWALFLVRGRFPGIGRFARARLTLVTAALLLARRLGLVDHETLKRRLQHQWQRATEADEGAAERLFLDELDRFVRPSLRKLLAAIAAGEHDAVLATAAAGDYAEAFGARLGFRHVLATQRIRPAGELSNDGERKSAAVIDFLAQQGWHDRRLVLLTDHEDDLPLFRVCSTVYWFGREAPRQPDGVTAVILPGDAAGGLVADGLVVPDQRVSDRIVR
jgi:phosphoserine phosphatase